MSDQDHYVPKLREDTPEFREFSIKNRQILELVHPRETLAVLASVPLAVYILKQTISLTRKERLFGKKTRIFLLGMGGVGAFMACGLCALGCSSLKLVAQSPERSQLLQYLDKHDGKLWRYKYFSRPTILWMAGNPKEHTVKDYQYRGR